MRLRFLPRLQAPEESEFQDIISRDSCTWTDLAGYQFINASLKNKCTQASP